MDTDDIPEAVEDDIEEPTEKTVEPPQNHVCASSQPIPLGGATAYCDLCGRPTALVRSRA